MADESEEGVRMPRGVDDPERGPGEFAQYEALAEVLPDPVFVMDRSGYLTYVNPAFAELFGYDIPGDGEVHISEFLSEGDVDTIIELLRGMAVDRDRDARRRTVELGGVARDGRTRTFSASVAPLPGGDGFSGAAAVLRDVTARKRRDEVFRVMDRALRHNLRTDVNIIIGYAQQLEEELGDEYRTSLRRIREAGEWIHKLGSSLRTLQKTIDESFSGDGTASIEEVVEAAVESALPADPDADVSVHVPAHGSLEAGSLVQYVLENIVANAVVHNDTDTPTVDVWAAHAPRDGWIDIHVADDGPGIPELEREIVIGEASVDQLQHGSGLGLWITRWVVEMFDGDLEIEDDDPRGTVVTLRLPLAGEPGDPA